MTHPARHDAPADEMLDPVKLASLQKRKLDRMLRQILPANEFYRRKLEGIRFDALRDDLAKLPLTTRQEIERDQLDRPPYGSNLTYPLSRYRRFHQTSGSGGRPVRWLDTAESWEWFSQCWSIILRGAGVRPGDRMMFPFSFGPFVGFWAAFESAAALGHLCLPAGGMTTSARLRMLVDNAVDVVFCTPTYALRMAETAAEEGIDLAGAPVRALIVAGEPGGSIPAVRSRIERAWRARVFDHSGMTEIGAVSYECLAAPGGLHVIESEFIAEVIPAPGSVAPGSNAAGSAVSGSSTPQTPATGTSGGGEGELVLTNLGRWGSPLIRYRTGDIVRMTRGRCACGSGFARLEGGILGRVDDMFIVRGNNVFPSAVEAVLRRFPEVAEFRLCVQEGPSLTRVRLEIEPARDAPAGHDLAERVGQAVHAALSFRAQVVMVSPGTLPRFEMKARRFVREAT